MMRRRADAQRAAAASASHILGKPFGQCAEPLLAIGHFLAVFREDYAYPKVNAWLKAQLGVLRPARALAQRRGYEALYNALVRRTGSRSSGCSRGARRHMKIADYKSGHHQSFLAPAEQKLVRALIAELPDSISPLQLTRIGFFGAVVTAVALVCSCWSTLWTPLIPLGVFLNWFGAALDGPLAVRRRTTDPRFGLLEHTYDLFSQILIIVAFGISPFLSMESALVVLICYLLFSAYTYIRAIARHVQQMAYIGLGATEFRILMALWPFAAHAMGIDETIDVGHSQLDSAILILAAFAICGLGIKALSDARRVSVDESGRGI